MICLISETENTITELSEKCINLEKSKERSLSDIDDLNLELDRISQKSKALEKRANSYEKIILEWKTKADELKVELHDCRRCQK